MEIGIIGKGKMGREIFNHLLQYDYKLIIVCREKEAVEKLTASIEKLLRKMVRRGQLASEALASKMEDFKVTSELEDLATCDVVIESITEDLLSKQKIFKMLEAIVGPECVLATNTSSIPLKLIFEKCFRKDRCMGIHFFFPVKLTQIVEINKMHQTGEKYVEHIKSLLEAIQKKPIELEEHNNMIVNKILLTLIAQMFHFYDEGILTIEALDAVLKEKLLTYGLFEIVDATGLYLILKSVENFMDNRHRRLYTTFYITGEKLVKAGYGGGPDSKGIADYCKDYPKPVVEIDSESLNDYKEKILLVIQSLLVNEIAYLGHSQHIDLMSINHGIKEVLGLSDDVMNLLSNVGAKKVESTLKSIWIEKEDLLYKPEELSILIQ